MSEIYNPELPRAGITFSARENPEILRIRESNCAHGRSRYPPMPQNGQRIRQYVPTFTSIKERARKSTNFTSRKCKVQGAFQAFNGFADSDKAIFAGVAVYNASGSSVGKPLTAPDFAVRRQGIVTIINNGEDDIRYGDLLMWDYPTIRRDRNNNILPANPMQGDMSGSLHTAEIRVVGGQNGTGFTGQDILDGIVHPLDEADLDNYHPDSLKGMDLNNRLRKLFIMGHDSTKFSDEEKKAAGTDDDLGLRGYMAPILMNWTPQRMTRLLTELAPMKDDGNPYAPESAALMAYGYCVASLVSQIQEKVRSRIFATAVSSAAPGEAVTVLLNAQ